MFLTAATTNTRSSLGGFNNSILNNLSSIGGQLQKTLRALSTGYRVNTAADDPAASAEISRTDANLNNVASALNNNELSLNRLSSIDGVQRTIVNTLLEIRNNAKELQNSGDYTQRQTMMETVAAQISALDTLVANGKLGTRNVLNGGSTISLGINSLTCLDPGKSFVRSVRGGSSLRAAFNAADAAEEARVSGEVTLPSGSSSTFMVTTNRGSKTIELNDGVSLGDALKQMNKSLESIGARAEATTDASGATTLSFVSNGHGNKFSVRYDHISGARLLANNASDTGKDGVVRINSRNFKLSGEYANAAAESAKVSGAAATGAIATTDLTFATNKGTATLADFTAATIEQALEAINAAAEIQELGINARLDNGTLSFSSSDTGTAAFIDFRDSAGSLFADGRQSAAASGRAYAPGLGLAVDYATPEITATLAFAYDKVAVATPANGLAAPASFSVEMEPTGGTTFQIGAGNGFYDTITYGFHDLTSDGLGLNQLIDSTSDLYLMRNDGSAIDFIDSVISKVEREYGALGAFMNYGLNSTNSAMEALQSSLSDTRSVLADADMARETLTAVRLQILQSSNIAALTSSASFSQMMNSLLPTAS
ncbi:MAG: hypothetical protein J6333_00590 [Planctomycetes bacterium]|nr:hypothetical protein [Planctomycetota bacterium]